MAERQAKAELFPAISSIRARSRATHPPEMIRSAGLGEFDSGDESPRLRMATENPTWGSTRIRGGLKRLGHDAARNTIKAILKDHGIRPAPERGTKTPWKTFLAAHWDGLSAAV